ncbi:hypothetical protein [Sphingobacterium deserti]|uniref:Uncharacterized protein n=2 Tax=Sphingobacterium TaxID=28453 RepID=A0A0B8SZZ4_9SPHI|nr:hypothetical protein [Sphingobacterium deserti]KGE13622.1 hypothetical protein DI53_2683 [Sphingobacterium deserti]TDS12365.1 hypothetical protein B0I21_106223 [Sphingobacterium paludis]
MWYLILALLFGQGGQTGAINPGQSTVQTNTDPGDGDDGDGGDTGLPIPPPRPPKK